MSEKLETIAYAIQEGIYYDSVFIMIAQDAELKDKRLIPYIYDAIRSSTGNNLIMAIESAYFIRR